MKVADEFALLPKKEVEAIVLLTSWVRERFAHQESALGGNGVILLMRHCLAHCAFDRLAISLNLT